MNTKIIILSAALSISTFLAQAQKKVSVGISAGVNLQNITGKDPLDNDMSNSVVARFNGGLKVNFKFAEDFYLQSGILFASKGAKMSTMYLNQLTVQNINLNYIEVPLNFVYKPLVGSGHLLLGFGPYAAYAISGKATVVTGGPSRTLALKNEVSASDTNNLYFKPFEMGANLFAGYEFTNKISIQLNAQLGLTKINPVYANTANKSALKNSGFGISLGYRF
ncbi:MAG: PorT family protein [Bacteroidia bacterium]|nr:PorT family protein [Bacteroidia bacterium]